MAMAIKIVRSSESEWQAALTRGPFSQRRKALGGEKLQCGLWELAPGKKSFPLHAHAVTEEAMFVISGRGKVRGSDGEQAIGASDFVSFPAGTAHQLINDSDEPLVYLAIAATQGFDIVEYPDSGKVACAIGAFPTGRRMMFRAKDQVDYFDGEE
jgi:uncharacterized cupin superfamily protein